MEMFVMLYNPQERGADVNTVSEGKNVILPQGDSRSYPVEIGEDLLKRYRFLHRVVDHPSAWGKVDPFPSGVEGWEPPKAVKKEVEPTMETRVPLPTIKEVPRTHPCPSCEKVFKSYGYLNKHIKAVHSKLDV